ncbi:MAG: NAD(P)/FAD-dependent oxidoreductase [Ruminococcaceae bacterium]|nr:NAD(P)/FAD-dependent oxidoreductase [Oscillospiraceae bacterium]
MTMQENKTAIIIGAGPAGLTAAYCLLKETDIKPIILEEEGFVGGISRTYEYKGNRMDLGGHRFFSKSEEVNQLWQELMPMQSAPSKDDIILNNEKPLAKEGPDPEKEDRVMLLRNRVSRIYYLHKFFDYPISLKAETFKNMGFKRTVKAGFGYVKSCLFKKEEDSLRNFYINRFGTPLYEMFFEDYTEKLWGRNPSEISADWGAQRVKGLSLFKAVMSVLSKPFKKKGSKVETSLIEQYSYPKKGPGQLWQIMADEIVKMGGSIVYNTKVEEIVTSDGKVEKVIASQNGEKAEFGADVFFSTMPVKDLVCGMGEGVPADVKHVAENLPYRDFITVGLLVNKLKIKNQTKINTVSNIVPDCWIYIQEREVKLGRLQIFNNWSPYMVKDLENTVWIGLEYFCSEGDEMWNMSDEDFIKFAINELDMIDVIDKEDVLDSVRLKVKKAYPAYFDTYSQFDTVREYLDSFENLWCIGRNGQHRYNNMDHSMLTAMEAVHAIAKGETDKSVVWNVNTEKEYHEEAKAK